MKRDAGAEPRWWGHAFGLAIDASFEVAGWPSSAAHGDLARVSIEREKAAALRRRVPPGSRAIAWRPTRSGGVEPDVVGHSRAGYLFNETGIGLFHVSRGGRHVSCGDSRAAQWRWQRHLFGRILPFACTVRGLEPLHAGAVKIGGSAIALVGSSGVGKSTLLSELMLRGAQFVADDVLSLEPSDGRPTVHPGPPLMSLRRHIVDRLGEGKLQTIGSHVGGDMRSVRLAVSRQEQPLALATMYMLERVEAGQRASLMPLSSPEPRWLLGSTFNAAIRSSSRLIRQLEMFASIARLTRIVNVAVPADADYRALARDLDADARAQSGGRR